MNALSVLVIEDEEMDIRALQRAFFRQGLSHLLHVVKDASQALNMLGAGDYVLPRPCIVLLDQNLPGMSGLEFLEALRQRPDVAPVEVYYVTAALSHIDAERAKRLGVRACLHKDNLGSDMLPLIELLQGEGHLPLTA